METCRKGCLAFSRSHNSEYQSSSEYYRQAQPAASLLTVVVVFYLLPVTAFSPEHIPPRHLTGYLHDVLAWMAENYPLTLQVLFLLCLLTHIGEMIFALMICTYIGLGRRSQVKWALSVLLLGMISLQILVRRLFDVEQKKRHISMKTQTQPVF